MSMSETSQDNMLRESLEWHQWAEEIAEMIGMPLPDAPVTSSAELRDSIFAYLSAARDAAVATRAQGPARCECPAPCPQHPERNPPKGRT